MMHSQCGRACSARYGTEHPLGQRCTSPPAGGSTSPVGSGRRTGRWTAAPTSGCHPRFHYTSGSDPQTCRSCASQSPCTSAGRAGRKKQHEFVTVNKYKMYHWAETNLLWFKCLRLNQSFLHYIFSICIFWVEEAFLTALCFLGHDSALKSFCLTNVQSGDVCDYTTSQLLVTVLTSRLTQLLI